MHRWVPVVVLGCAAPVLAQPQPTTEEILIDPQQPKTIEREPTTNVPLPPSGPGRDAFVAESISVDLMRNEVALGKKPLPAREFYLRVNRPDLVACSEDRTRQRIWLMSGGGLALVAGLVSGALVLTSGPNTSSPECLTGPPAVYNDCLNRAEKAQMTGAALIGAGIAVGGALIVWGMSTPEMVTEPAQTLALATEYNRALARKHGATEVSLRVLPAFGPGYGGLVARLTF